MFQTSVAVPPAPVRVSSQSSLAPSVASVTSVANDKGDNEMIPGAVHRPPRICLTARRPSMKAVRPVIASNRVPYLQIRLVGSHSTSGNQKEGKKERTG